MATFTVHITTPSAKRPVDRREDVAERAAIQQVLLQVVSAVSNTGAYQGAVTGSAATATFDYEDSE